MSCIDNEDVFYEQREEDLGWAWTQYKNRQAPTRTLPKWDMLPDMIQTEVQDLYVKALMQTADNIIPSIIDQTFEGRTIEEDPDKFDNNPGSGN